ncbi:pentapeptide repeat-containing protein [Micromonospora sp. NPDC047793]|uniref:pentapeptide repeat-containing protein n=1 Tax=Micromonospora sp. NPDC047793 TaxID=3154342 RepID=UPI0033CE8D74
MPPLDRNAWSAKIHKRLTVGRTIALVGFSSGAIVVLLIVLLGPVAWWATPSKHLQGKEKTDARNGTRQVLLAAAGGTAALMGLLFTARTFRLTRRGQLTDRYSRATAQLASEKQTERLAGIYALEHVMAESVRDHGAVVAILAAFVRERRPLSGVCGDSVLVDKESARVEAEKGGVDAAGRSAIAKQFPSDVQAALTVLGRRPRRPEQYGVDLRNSDLTGADLSGTYFPNLLIEYSFLSGANLSEAELTGLVANNADLEGVNLRKARLKNAQLREVVAHGACLDGAQFGDADFHGSVFREISAVGANFRGAVMDYAVFDESNFGKCDMREASLIGASVRRVNLSCARLAKANLSKAKIQRSNLLGADVREANFDRIGMEGAVFYSILPEEGVAKNLTANQVLKGFRDHTTVLPPELRNLPPGLQRFKGAIRFASQPND